MEPPSAQAPAGEVFTGADGSVTDETSIGFPASVVFSLGGGRSVEVWFDKAEGVLKACGSGGTVAMVAPQSGEALAFTVVPDGE